MLHTICLVLLTTVAVVEKSPYETARFSAHDAPVTSVVVAPEGEAVSLGLDGTIQRWDLQTTAERGEKPVNVFDFGEMGSDDQAKLAISASGELLSAVWGDDVLYLWVRTYPKASVFTHGKQPNRCAVVFSPDGNLLAAGDADGSVALYDTSNTYKNGTFTTISWDRKRDLIAKGKIAALAFSPDSKALFTLGKTDRDYAVQLWNPESGKIRGERVADGPALAIAPNGKSFVTGRTVWNMADAQPLAVLAHYFTLNSAVFSPDSKWLATGGDDTRLIFWDPQTGRKLAMVRAHDDKINSLAVTKDGKYLVSGSNDYTARVWDVAKILAEKPMDEPFAKLATIPKAHAAWRLGLCWAQGTRNYQPDKPTPKLLEEAYGHAKAFRIKLPDPPEKTDDRGLVEYLSGKQDALAEEIKANTDQIHGELFLAGALLPTLQIFFDPSNDAMKQLRDEILPGMSAEFVKSFDALPTMFDRVNSNLIDQVDHETMSETLAMLIRETDLYLEAQAKAKK